MHIMSHRLRRVSFVTLAKVKVASRTGRVRAFLVLKVNENADQLILVVRKLFLLDDRVCHNPVKYLLIAYLIWSCNCVDGGDDNHYSSTNPYYGTSFVSRIDDSVGLWVNAFFATRRPVIAHVLFIYKQHFKIVISTAVCCAFNYYIRVCKAVLVFII